MNAKQTNPYRLRYLTEDDRYIANLRPCHLCCFGGQQLDCQKLCKILGANAYFIKNTELERSKDKERRKNAWIKEGFDPRFNQ